MSNSFKLVATFVFLAIVLAILAGEAMFFLWLTVHAIADEI